MAKRFMRVKWKEDPIISFPQEENLVIESHLDMETCHHHSLQTSKNLDQLGCTLNSLWQRAVSEMIKSFSGFPCWDGAASHQSTLCLHMQDNCSVALPSTAGAFTQAENRHLLWLGGIGCFSNLTALVSSTAIIKCCGLGVSSTEAYSLIVLDAGKSKINLLTSLFPGRWPTSHCIFTWQSD